eukprot:XP_001710183.1 Hypothetical protein GL50803_6059 [Giardia lamblia ATCC 50803]
MVSRPLFQETQFQEQQPAQLAGPREEHVHKKDHRIYKADPQMDSQKRVRRVGKREPVTFNPMGTELRVLPLLQAKLHRTCRNRNRFPV